MKLSIDLGGTNIRIAQVKDDCCLDIQSIPCLAQANASSVLEQLFQLIESRMEASINGIGIDRKSVV